MTEAPSSSPTAPRAPHQAKKPSRKPHTHKRQIAAARPTAHLIRRQLHPVR